MKKGICAELSYIVGVAFTALGTALMAAAGFGVSMVVAPAYLIHLKLGISFGTAEYAFQALLLCLMMLVLRRFKLSWLFSFVTAVFYGLMLDLFGALAALLTPTLAVRIVYFIAGELIISLGIAVLFRTYLPPEVYELIVKECSAHFKIKLSRFKLGYDIASLLLGVLMSILFFGRLEGIGWGTLAAALLTGPLISFFSRFLKNTGGRAALPRLKTFFEK
jgi:uncharacterized membrane protein YczE